MLLDGRSIYLDFFGLVLWDLVPTNPNDIKQIEVVRGPASAVWGANALSGVVNIITKTPRESQGVNLDARRRRPSTATPARSRARAAARSTALGATIARAPNDTLSFRLSAGYFNSDAYSRPVGHRADRPPPARSRRVVDTAARPTRSTAAARRDCVPEHRAPASPSSTARLDQELAGGGRT